VLVLWDNSQCKKGKVNSLVPRIASQPTGVTWNEQTKDRQMSEQNIDERRQNRILVGTTVNVPGDELANRSHTHECIVGSQLQFPISTGTAYLSFSDSDTMHLLGRKITISVHRGKNTVTKVEGIPAQYSLSKLLKKLKAKDMLSCGGHVAKDRETGNEFLVLQGSFSNEVASFLTREGLADTDSIVHRG